MPRRGQARQALMDAALALTYRGGIIATGVDAIATEAGVTKRTLYAHFTSKDDLIASALAEVEQGELDQLLAATRRRAAKTSEPPVLALFDILERILAGPGGAGCRFLNAALELGDQSHPVVVVARRHLRRREDMVAVLLAESVPDDPSLCAQIVLLVDGAFTVGATRGDPSAATHAKRAARTLIGQSSGGL